MKKRFKINKLREREREREKERGEEREERIKNSFFFFYNILQFPFCQQNGIVACCKTKLGLQH